MEGERETEVDAEAETEVAGEAEGEVAVDTAGDAGAAKDARIADLEAKVEGLAAAVKVAARAAPLAAEETSAALDYTALAVQAAAAPPVGSTGKRHRPYRSYFECIHWNMARGSLRTSTRSTLNRQAESRRVYEHSP